ncbi:type II toxin-antitoxin system HicB family antitoxin [Candidatus Peregrinibacteria bacterium]|nr:type II toxin-antitoxin system HicB family antitoxin [Candidatus Peregrinibacteria bacterium]
MTYRFPAVITQDKDGMYVAHVPMLRGCHTQAKSLPVLHKRLQEVMALCLEVERSKRQSIPQDRFVALEHIEIAF